MNTRYPRKSHVPYDFVAVIVTFIVLATSLSYSQVSLTVPLRILEPPIEMELSPLPERTNLNEYQAFHQRLALLEGNERIVIMVLAIKNPLPIPVTTTLADIVPITGKTRHLFVAYCVKNPDSSRPTYALPDWETPLQIRAERGIRLRLAFIVKKGEHALFEGSLKVYCHFEHAEWNGVYHSISGSQRVDSVIGEAGEQIEVSQYGVQRQVLQEFKFSDELNPVSVRELLPPTTAISPGGASKFLEPLLGEKGKESQLPYWIGIPQAVENSGFDYDTAMQFMNLISDYRTRFPNKLARTSIWLNIHEVLLVPTQHRVYMATSVWGVVALPHEVAEVLLFVGEQTLLLGFNPTDIAPKPGSYTPQISSNPGDIIGFDIECTSGIKIHAARNRNVFQIQITDAEGNEIPVPLTYRR
jgi:hypothetical protein